MKNNRNGVMGIGEYEHGVGGMSNGFGGMGGHSDMLKDWTMMVVALLES